MKNSRIELSKINTELQKLNCTEKLNYWYEIYKTKISEQLKTSTIVHSFERVKILTELFGKDYKLISPILIPNIVYNEYFKDGLDNPEFTYWFLKYNAGEWLEINKQLHKIDEKVNSPLAILHIEGELKEINNFEQRANQLLLDKKIDIYKDYSYSEFSKEIEYLRIRANYYETNPLWNVQAIGNKTVVLYAKHILLKEHLEKELARLSKIIAGQHTETNYKKYSHKQIAIAYWAMGILLTNDNALEILTKYSINRSIDRLLRQQVIKPSQLTVLSKDKTADTKHLKCLIAAKQLISSTRTVQNKKDAIKKIDNVITAFKTTYDNEY